MLADAEVAIGYFLALLLAVTIPTCIALIASQLGRYNLIFVACGWMPVLFAAYLSGSGIYDFCRGWLVDRDPIDPGVITFPLALSAPFFWAGLRSLSRMKKNKLQRTRD